MPDKETQRSKYKTSRGVPWSEVRIEELSAMVQDGLVAAALLQALRDLKSDDLEE